MVQIVGNGIKLSRFIYSFCHLITVILSKLPVSSHTIGNKNLVELLGFKKLTHCMCLQHTRCSRNIIYYAISLMCQNARDCACILSNNLLTCSQSGRNSQVLLLVGLNHQCTCMTVLLDALLILLIKRQIKAIRSICTTNGKGSWTVHAHTSGSSQQDEVKAGSS